MPVVDLLIPALFVSLGVGSTAGILAWRQRPEPGARALSALLVGQCWWSATLLFRVQAETTAAKLVWTRLGWVGVMLVPLAWLLFVLEYTGRDEYVTAPVVGSLAIVPVATVVIAITEPANALLEITYRPVADAPVGAVEQGGPWYPITAAYTYTVGGVGLGLIGALLVGDSPVFRRQGALLLGGLVLPAVANLLFISGWVSTPIDPTPIAFSASGAAYLSALTRHRLLGNTPAPNRRAREVLLEQFHHGAVVVDRNDYISKVNRGSEQILGVDAETALNAPAEEVFPEYDRLPSEGALEEHLTVGRSGSSRSFDVVVTEITNVRGTCLGRVVTFHEVTDYLRQQQRLRTLNRVFRHNIRTETNIIRGYADQLPAGEETAIIRRRAEAIADLGEKGRTAVELFEHANRRTTPAPVAPMLEACVADVTEKTGPAEVTYRWERPDTEVCVPALLEEVCYQLVENAVEHTTAEPPSVHITTTYDTGPDETPQEATIRITDDGPGIDGHELAVLERASEGPLEHGSGLGLWIAKWGVDMVRGELEFLDRERGTTAVLTVPATTARAAPDWDLDRARRHPVDRR